MRHMIRPLFIVLLAALFGPALVSCQGAAPVRVMAYNVKHGLGNDGHLDLERIARVIEAQDPDVVTLQEIDVGCTRSGEVDQATWLGERLGMEARFGPFMDYQGGQYGMAVLSKLPILESTNHALPPGPEPRTALAVRVAAPRGGPFWVVGIHLYATEAERLAQAEALLGALSSEDDPIVLAGDFNSEPGSVVMDRFAEEFVNVEKGADHFTFDSVHPSKEIDFVLVRPAGAFENPALDVLDEPLASDHRPLILEAKMRAH